MSQKSVVADAVESVFTLAADVGERIAVAAEMCADATFDFSKGCDLVATELGALKSAGLLTFDSWEAVRIKFETVAETRGRDNGLADPKGAANDCWGRVVKRNADIHGLKKPKSENPEAERKRAEREAKASKALAQAQGKSSAELLAHARELYGQASDDSIAQAKAIEKIAAEVLKVEKTATQSQIKPLMSAASEAHKAIMEFMKEKNDPKLLGDYVVLLKRTLDIWKSQ